MIHNLVSFATVVPLWTLVTLLIKLIRMLLKWKYRHCKNYAILAAMMRKRSYFVTKVSSWSPGLECSYEEIFIPVTEISGPLHMSPVTELAQLPGRIPLSVHMGNFSPVDRDEIQETKPKW